jgi:three-Cys-motif partner protein
MQRKLLVNDGLETPEVGAWAEEKYRLLQGYARVFATSMKRQWIRIYIDLFAGSGRSRIEGTNRIVLASPLLALEIPHRFDRYIFCEKDNEKIDALRKRITSYPEADVRFLHGDANILVNKILAEFPSHDQANKVLAFCFADPFSLENLKFSTIEQLASRFVDFLILIPTGMDANRNVRLYSDPNNRTVDNFVGTSEWRAEWEKAKLLPEPFGGFLTKLYAERMKNLRYINQAAEQSQLVRSTRKNLPLYRLTFFSRHPLGEKFWKEIKKYASPQQSLDLG